MEKVIYLGSSEGYQATFDVLSDLFKVKHVDASINTIKMEIVSAVAILDASMRTVISNEMIHSAEKLKIVSCATTGSDHIEREVINEKNISVHTLREDSDLLKDITPAAELTWALLLACARNLVSATKDVKSGNWKRENFPGIMLNGRRIGLIGCGRIGQWVARYGQAFGMQVYGYDPYLDIFPDTIKRKSLETIFSTCDFISIHVHLNSETQGLVSRSLLSLLKPGSIIINTSRGAIIDEASLLDGLQDGRIGGVGLDVLVGEPDIRSNALVSYSKKHDNVLITPHCGGYSPDAVKLVCKRAATKIRDFFSENTSGPK